MVSLSLAEKTNEAKIRNISNDEDWQRQQGKLA